MNTIVPYNMDRSRSLMCAEEEINKLNRHVTVLVAVGMLLAAVLGISIAMNFILYSALKIAREGL